VVEWLGGDYEVEIGHGANRSEYLYKHNITTYLITDNQPRMKVALSQLIMRCQTTRSFRVLTPIGDFGGKWELPLASKITNRIAAN